jgi:ligand-binding sensor domain-containing protein
MLQDNRGLLWFGTEDGLNRYDGNTFLILRHDPWNPGTLSNNNITCLLEQSGGILWIGTEKGLNRLDRNTMTLSRFPMPLDSTGSWGYLHIACLYLDSQYRLWIGTRSGLYCYHTLSSQWRRPEQPEACQGRLGREDITSILADSSGNLWVGTDENGLYRCVRTNPDSGIFSSDRFLASPSVFSGLSSDRITALTLDTRGHLWIGTYDQGLCCLDPDDSEKPIRTFRHSPDDPSTLSHNSVLSVSQDRNGVLWVGTENGLNRLDPGRKKFIRYFKSPGDPSSLNNDNIWAIMEDRSGVLWFGTDNGLNKWDRREKLFTHIRHDPSNPRSLSNNYIWGFCEDSSGYIWIATNGGLNQWDRTANRFYHHLHDPEDPKTISNNYILTVFTDREGKVWVGTNGSGLDRMVPSTVHGGPPAFINYAPDPENPCGLKSAYPMTICQDHQGTFWMGTFDRGICRMIPGRNPEDSPSFQHFVHEPGNPKSLPVNRIYALYEAPSEPGVLWAGTDGGGLTRIRLDSLSLNPVDYRHYQVNISDPHTISSNYVMAILEARSGDFWVGTYGGGLNHLDRETGHFTHYTVDNGLSNNVVYVIQEDHEGFLWLSTNKGLSRFHPETRAFMNFSLEDGLQDFEFNSGAALTCRNGDLLFGGINGFNTVRPRQIRPYSYIPPVVFTGLKLFNHPVPVGESQNDHFSLPRSISETKVLDLSHKQDVLTLEFAALSYVCPEQNAYAYIMENFETEWNFVGNRRFAPYSHIPPGEYIFRVRAANHDGIWNTAGASLIIHIHPPFWQTVWFRLLAAGSVIILVLLGIRIRTQTLRRRNRLLEERIQIRTSDLRKTNTELTKTLDQVKTLEGLLPICAYCKKIRDDSGYWQQVETYISRRTDAQFSHGYCPECYQKLCRELGLEEKEGGFGEINRNSGEIEFQ